MSNENDPTTEERLRRALTARDAEVRPSPGALAAIRERGSARSPWRRAPLVIAAALLLLAGVVAGISLLGDDDDAPDVAVDGPTTTPPTSPTTPTIPTTPTTESVDPPTTTIPGPVDPLTLAYNGLVIWPRDSRSFDSMETAARSYVTEVLGVVDPILEFECCDDRTGHVRLRAQGEGGRELDHDAALMTLVASGDTWDLVLVESSEMVIDSVASGLAGVLVVGHGSAFEGTGVLTATSRCDPDSITTEIVGVGARPDAASFTATIDPPDCDVVIIQLTASGVAEGSTPAVASVAVPGRPRADIVVMRVDTDDVLNVRAGAGTEHPIVATLAGGWTP